MSGFRNVKNQKQLNSEPTCQECTKEGEKDIQGMVITEDHPAKFFVYAYQGKQISALRICLGQRRIRPRCGRNDNFKTGSHPASLSSVLNRGRQGSEFYLQC